MKLRFIAAYFALLCSFGSAFGQSCTSYPYTLTNGTTADASQLMANFNYVLNCISGASNSATMRGWLAGLTMANNATSPNTAIDTAAGVANSDDASTLMTLTAFSKNANAGWAVGTGNGCLDTGSALAASTWYHLFVIARTDTGVVDLLCSTSATAPSFPSPYTKKRRIGSFRTNSSSQILGFSQVGDDFLWKAPMADAIGLSVTSPRNLVTTSVPPGVQVNVNFTLEAGSTAGATSALLTSPDQADTAALNGQQDLWTNGAGQWAASRFTIRTNTSAQIGIRSGGASSVTYWITTVGWTDARGRFN